MRAVLHHDLDRVVDPVAGVADRGRHLGEREGVGVDQLRLEALLRDQRRGAVRRAPAFAADAEDVDVVAHEMREIDHHRLVRERREADAAAAIDHPPRLVQARWARPSIRARIARPCRR